MTYPLYCKLIVLSVVKLELCPLHQWDQRCRRRSTFRPRRWRIPHTADSRSLPSMPSVCSQSICSVSVKQQITNLKSREVINMYITLWSSLYDLNISRTCLSNRSICIQFEEWWTLFYTEFYIFINKKLICGHLKFNKLTFYVNI